MRKVAGDVNENRENLNGDLTHFADKDDKLPRERRIKKNVFNLRLFPIPHNINFIQGVTISFSRNRQDRLRNRFYASFRMAANAKRTP